MSTSAKVIWLFFVAFLLSCTSALRLLHQLPRTSYGPSSLSSISAAQVVSHAPQRHFTRSCRKNPGACISKWLLCMWFFVVCFLVVCLVRAEVPGRSCIFLSFQKVTLHPAVSLRRITDFSWVGVAAQLCGREQSSQNFSACSLMMTEGLEVLFFGVLTV